jgi:hypothetical protein
MIQTKQPIVYGDRSDKTAKIKIVIHSYSATPTGATYLVNDYAVIDGKDEIISAKEVSYSNEQIDQLSAYIDSTTDFTGFTKTQKEWAKIKIGLMIDTQTNLLESGKTIYKLTPQDWEFSE